MALAPDTDLSDVPVLEGAVDEPARLVVNGPAGEVDH